MKGASGQRESKDKASALSIQKDGDGSGKAKIEVFLWLLERLILPKETYILKDAKSSLFILCHNMERGCATPVKASQFLSSVLIETNDICLWNKCSWGYRVTVRLGTPWAKCITYRFFTFNAKKKWQSLIPDLNLTVGSCLPAYSCEWHEDLEVVSWNVGSGGVGRGLG